MPEVDRLPPQAAVRLEKLLYRNVKETCESYELLRPGDRIMVAMSGGKELALELEAKGYEWIDDGAAAGARA